MGLKPLDDLGHLIEGRWSQTGYDPHELPAIAETALSESNLPGCVSPDEILEWALSAQDLPQQQDLEGRFGQPPITLFRSSRFYIEALNWVDGSTTIHQHAFSGAFLVLGGSSIETTYTFEQIRRFDGHFALGELRLRSTVLHRRGDITKIASGPQGLIHGLFHLDRPSTSIVVRTFHDADAGPQFSYTRNGIAIDPFFIENSRERILQIVGLFLKVDHANFERLIGDMLSRVDIHTAYRVLEVCSRVADRTRFDRLLDRVGDKQASSSFRQAFSESQRLALLYSRRAHVRDAEGRFFLGVLLNARRRQDVLDLVRMWSPDADPAQQVAAALHRLSKVTLRLQAGGTPWEPNVLGIPEMTDDLEEVLAKEFRGERPDLTPRAATFMETLRALPALSSLFL